MHLLQNSINIILYSSLPLLLFRLFIFFSLLFPPFTSLFSSLFFETCSSIFAASSLFCSSSFDDLSLHADQEFLWGFLLPLCRLGHQHFGFLGFGFLLGFRWDNTSLARLFPQWDFYVLGLICFFHFNGNGLEWLIFFLFLPSGFSHWDFNCFSLTICLVVFTTIFAERFGAIFYNTAPMINLFPFQKTYLKRATLERS